MSRSSSEWEGSLFIRKLSVHMVFLDSLNSIFDSSFLCRSLN